MNGLLVASSPAARWGCCAAVVCGLLLGPGAAAAAYRRRGYGGSYARAVRQSLINAANSQIAAGQQMLAAAESKAAEAQQKMSIAVGKLQSAAGELAEAQKAGREMFKHLQEIEKEILARQPENSEYALAKIEVEKARQQLAAVEAKLKLAGIKKDDDDKAIDTEYFIAKKNLSDAAKRIDKVRQELFHANSEWKETDAAMIKAHREEDVAERHVITGGMSRLGPLQKARDAAGLAAAARGAIAEAQSVLRGLNVAPPKTTIAPPSSTPAGAPLFGGDKK